MVQPGPLTTLNCRFSSEGVISRTLRKNSCASASSCCHPRLFTINAEQLWSLMKEIISARSFRTISNSLKEHYNSSACADILD